MPQDNHPAPEAPPARAEAPEAGHDEADAGIVQIVLPADLVGAGDDDDDDPEGDAANADGRARPGDGDDDGDDGEDDDEGEEEDLPPARTPLFREIRSLHAAIGQIRPDPQVSPHLKAIADALKPAPEFDFGPAFDKLSEKLGTIAEQLGTIAHRPPAADLSGVLRSIEAAIREDKDVAPALIAALIAGITANGTPNRNAEGTFIATVVTALSQRRDPGPIIEAAARRGAPGRFAAVPVRQLLLLPSILNAVLRILRPTRGGAAPVMAAAPSSNTVSARGPAESGSEQEPEIEMEDPGLETDADTQAPPDPETEAEVEPESGTEEPEVPVEDDSDPEAGTESEGTGNP